MFSVPRYLGLNGHEENGLTLIHRTGSSKGLENLPVGTLGMMASKNELLIWTDQGILRISRGRTSSAIGVGWVDPFHLDDIWTSTDHKVLARLSGAAHLVPIPETRPGSFGFWRNRPVLWMGRSHRRPIHSIRESTNHGDCLMAWVLRSDDRVNDLVDGTLLLEEGGNLVVKWGGNRVHSLLGNEPSYATGFLVLEKYHLTVQPRGMGAWYSRGHCVTVEPNQNNQFSVHGENMEIIVEDGRVAQVRNRRRGNLMGLLLLERPQIVVTDLGEDR